MFKEMEENVMRGEWTRGMRPGSLQAFSIKSIEIEKRSDENVTINGDNGKQSDQNKDLKFNDPYKIHICGISLYKSIVTSIVLASSYIFLLIFGGAIFHLLESPTELNMYRKAKFEYDSEKLDIMDIINNHNFTAGGNHSQELFEKLQPHSMGFAPEPKFEDTWTFENAIFFSFTIITTIGYGTFSPQTNGAKVFLIFYAIFGIPLAGISLVFFAERALYIFTWLSKVASDTVEEAFHHFDEDQSGQLEEDEFRGAIKKLGFRLTPAQFDKFWSQVDADAGGTIQLHEFRQAVELMHADVTEAAGMTNKVVITSSAILIWLGFGTAVFWKLESWNPGDSIYFIIVTLTTVGLGDYAPESFTGLVFLVVYTMVGLGMMAVLIALLQLVVTDLTKTTKTTKRKMIKHKLKQIPTFQKMDKGDLKKIMKKMTFIEKKPNRSIIKEGTQMDVLYILTEGIVTVTKEGSQEPRQISGPNFLSEFTILNMSKHFYAEESYSTATHAEMLSMNREDWEELYYKIDMSKYQEVEDSVVSKIDISITGTL